MPTRSSGAYRYIGTAAPLTVRRCWLCHARRCRRWIEPSMRPRQAWVVAPVMLADAPDGEPEIILIATGSRLGLAVDAHETLVREGIRSRVVSMPSWDVFESQSQGLSRQRSAAADRGSRRGRAGLHVRLGTLCGTPVASSACIRSARRHRWRLRKIWLRARTRRRGGERGRCGTSMSLPGLEQHLRPSILPRIEVLVEHPGPAPRPTACETMNDGFALP